MEQNKYTYQIGNKTYIQKPLVLGQVNQLMAVLRGVSIPQTADTMLLIAALGSKLPVALAIVLHEDPQPSSTAEFIYLRDRDLTALADELEFNIDPLVSVQVAEDFFGCNPIASLLERLSGATANIMGEIKSLNKTVLSPSSSSSPEATSPAAKQSSGTTP